MQHLKSFFIITLSTIIMAIGVYFFKFPNNFCFGGVTGAAVVFAKILPMSASSFSFVVNMALLVVGFAFLGKSFALRTTYATVLLSGLLVVFERIFPLSQPLSNEPMLELIFAIALPAIASALLFYEGSSSGGTDVVAMIVKKYAHVDDIGIALFVTDLIMIIIACFVFDIKTALYSFVGLTLKSFLIDAIIENIMLRKSIMITCDEKDLICHFITAELEKGATIVEATGAYTNEKRYLIFTTLTRKQAAALRAFIHQNKLHAFISMSSTSEVFGKGFTSI